MNAWRRLRDYLSDWWFSHGYSLCYMCWRPFPNHAFWNPWHGERLTIGRVFELFAKGELTSAQAAAETQAIRRGTYGLCCSEECCEAARPGSTAG